VKLNGLLAFATTLLVLPCAAQPDMTAAMSAAAEQQRAAVATSMASSLDQQRQAVQAQARSAISVAAPVKPESFFTVPWPAPPVARESAADCDALRPAQVEELVQENARRQDLPPDLLREVMRRESNFRPCAVSKVGAQGLMQLMPATAEDLRVTDVFDAHENAAAGAKLLRMLLDRYRGDIALALGAYNAGPARVDRAGGVPPIPETRDYLMRILSAVMFE
jgi:soluble lytic murein transglycosylase-like protein